MKLVGWLSCYIPPSSQGPWNFKSFNVVRLQFQTSGDQSSEMKNPYDLNDGWFPPWLSEKLKSVESANGRSVNIVSTWSHRSWKYVGRIRHHSGSIWLCDGCSSSRRRLLSPILEVELVNFSLFQLVNSKALPAASVSATCPAISMLTARVYGRGNWLNGCGYMREQTSHIKSYQVKSTHSANG